MSTTNLALRYLADEATRPVYAADEGAWADRLRRWSVVGRIISLMQGLPDVALPVEPPPIVQPGDAQPGRRGAQHQPGPPPPPPPPRTRRRRARGRQRAEAQRARAMLAHLGHVAELAESDETADGAMAAMAGWLSRLAGAMGGPAAQAPVRQAAPALRRALVDAGRALRGHAASRQHVRTLPYALIRAARSIAARAIAPGGRLPTARSVARTVAGEVTRVLGPDRTARAASRRVHSRPCPGCGARTGPARAGGSCGCGGHGMPATRAGAATRGARHGPPPQRARAATGAPPRSLARIGRTTRAALGRR